MVLQLVLDAGFEPDVPGVNENLVVKSGFILWRLGSTPDRAPNKPNDVVPVLAKV